MLNNVLAALTLGLVGIASSLPVVENVAVHSAAGSCLAPDQIFLLDEERPDISLPVTDFLFQVAQKRAMSGGRATGRKYLMVHFPATPSTASACQLQWNLPDKTNFVTYSGAHQLEVRNVIGYTPSLRPTWNSIVAASPSILGSGVLGSINLAIPSNAVIETGACSNAAVSGAVGGGYGLSYVFKLADWIEQAGEAASASFISDYTDVSGLFKGAYLSYNP